MKTLITALSALTVLFALTATPALADDKKSGAKTYSVSVSGVV